MTKYEKRRIVEQLPAINQTSVVKDFFSATVDHLFQNGKSETISGYIGQKPNYYDSTKDFYISESTDERQSYQLEPIMVSINESGDVTHKLCYTDLVNYLNFNGANTVNHSSLFNGEYYSWGPPIDLDKINNYTQYYWMGGLDDDTEYKTNIRLYAPRKKYVFDGDTSKRYALPPAITLFKPEDENFVTLVNGVAVQATYVNGSAVLVDFPNVGDVVETIRYGDLTKLIKDKSEFYFYPFIKWQYDTTGEVNGVYTFTIQKTYNVGDLVYVGDDFGNGDVYVCKTQHTVSGNTFDSQYWAITTNGLKATSGSRVTLIDGIGTNLDNGRKYFIDYSNSVLYLSDDYTQHSNGENAHYVLNHRSSIDRNIWSLRNMWVHKSSLDWTGMDFTEKKAKRPIIEFLPNIELYNYGTRRLEDVQATLTTTQANVVDHWDIYSYDYNVWGQEKVNLSYINGKLFGRYSENDEVYLGSVIADNDYILQPNDRLLVVQANSNEPELNHYIYRVVSNESTPLPTGASEDVVELVLEDQPILGDIVRVVPGKGKRNDVPEYSVFGDLKTSYNNSNAVNEYWYNGEEFVAAQFGIIPLFKLFDSSQNALDDTNVYSDSNFTGSELFSYIVGTGSNDTYLGFPLKYNEYDQPLFEVDPIVNRVTYSNGEIIGYYYHHFIDDDTYSNNWFKSKTESYQNKIDGVYEIPLNLQANPSNNEVEIVSRNQWFDHFSEIMNGQTNFEGNAYSINNWRDTAKDYSLGTKILQHRSPLLKTMLLVSDERFDLIDAIKYVEAEYIRFKNKFIQAIIEINDSGVLTLNDIPETWCKRALLNLKLNKSIDFPFAFSKVGGDQYFIPPTPATLGLGKSTPPEIFYDNSFGAQLKMIRGHDGSTIPAFDDFRDDILLSLELLIYNNIPDEIKNNSIAVEIEDFLTTASYSGNYTFDEYNNMMLPMFNKWVQQNNLNFYTNSTFDQADPFTWNYSSVMDINREKSIGHWRGIFKKFYDTDKPHTAPWEMLGFYSKPSYWDTEYGLAPYTKGNTKLWDDIKIGLNRGDNTISSRYAKPNIYSYIPVDDYGNILSPFEAHLILEEPTYNQAKAEWKFGDWGPVEYLWRCSPSYPFAKSIATFLTKPSKFVEQGWDTVNNQKDNTGQYINTVYGIRPLDKNIYIHGEIDTNGNRVYGSGVQQWLSDYLLSKGREPSILGTAIRGLTVRLGYRMASFTDNSNLKILADNFGIVPSEDILVELYNSPSIGKENYSGVIVETVNNGWRLVGYDLNSPWFNVEFGDEGGSKGIISLSENEPVINKWLTGTYYPLNTYVIYNSTIYRAIKGHMSGTSFDSQYWTASSELVGQAPRVVTYQSGTGIVTKIPYGTVVYTRQEVANIILGHQRYLESRGWNFDQIDSETQEIQNFESSVKEFLLDSQFAWADGHTITLSPSAKQLLFSTSHGYISSVTENQSVLDYTATTIDREKITVNRLDGEISIISSDENIYGATLDIKEVEHILIFSNRTVFNDLIYDPMFNLRQPRLRIIGRRSADWAGRLDAPGFVLIDGEIKSNFDKAVEDFRYMYDIENSDNTTFSTMAKHVIGYDQKDYLSDLVVSDIQQFEFYQGMIKEKGSKGNFEKLMRSNFIDQDRNIKFTEEWAFKLDDFGSRKKEKTVEFYLEANAIKSNKQFVHFAIENSAVTLSNDWYQLTDIMNSTIDANWVSRPTDPLSTFELRDTFKKQSQDYPVSGYVKLDEADSIVFSYEDIPTLYGNATLSVGDTIWTHTVPATRDISNQSLNKWYLIGSYQGNGVWDSSNATTSENSSYITTNSEGNSVFRSKSGDAPFVTNNDTFIPVPGVTYNISFRVRKIFPATNGISSYIRPAFDVYNANSVLLEGGLGEKYGQGYISNSAAADYDLIDTSNWTINKWYEVGASWTCPSSPSYAFAKGRIRINRTSPGDGYVSFSNALYEMDGQTISVKEKKDWDIYKIFNMSSDGSENTVYKFVTNNEDIDVTTTRLYTNKPHGLRDEDIGSYLIIEGSSQTDPELEGMHQIFGYSNSYVEIYSLDNSGYDFTEDNNTSLQPKVKILKSIRFKTNDSMENFVSNNIMNDGDIVYVDGEDLIPWKTFKKNGATWEIDRIQPKRINVDRLNKPYIYNTKTSITSTQLYPEPSEVSKINVLSPLTGHIYDRARSNIDFISSYDPAIYSNSGDPTDSIDDVVNDISGTWADNYVGKIWWDLSTIRFLETETDNVFFGISNNDRYIREMKYRSSNFGKIAPKCSVDVYEWFKSTVSPLDYMTLSEDDTTGTYSGSIYNSNNPQWVEQYDFDSNGNRKLYYYFWIKNRTSNAKGKSLSTLAISNFISNPSNDDIPWFAPVSPNSLLVGGVSVFLDDEFNDVGGTVLSISREDEANGSNHDEWYLLRQDDERSSPPDALYEKIRDSLVGFDINLKILPYVSVSPKIKPSTNGDPIWVTNSGSIGTYEINKEIIFRLKAYDPEGQPLSFTLTSGNLPSGLSLDQSTGKIYGTTTSTNTWNFTVSVSDGIKEIPRNFSITII